MPSPDGIAFGSSKALRRQPPSPETQDLRAPSTRLQNIRVLWTLAASEGGPLLAPNRHMRMTTVPLLLLSALGLAACANTEATQPPQMAQLAQAITPPDRGGPPEPLSPTARALLKERMTAHARDMSDLVSAILLFDCQRIADRSDEIAADVNLSRPTMQDATELNASIPEKFFVRQDDLKAAARALAQSARTADPSRVALAYGQVSQTCVRCHADYRPRD